MKLQDATIDYAIMTGNPIDGFAVIGPFDDAEEANLWAEDQRFDDAWWCVRLFSKEEWEESR